MQGSSDTFGRPGWIVLRGQTPCQAYIFGCTLECSHDGGVVDFFSLRYRIL